MDCTSDVTQRNFMVTTPLSGLEPKFVSLLTSRSCFESRVHCWFAAVRAASLAGAMPPLEVRDESVNVSGPTVTGSVTCASVSCASVLQPGKHAVRTRTHTRPSFHRLSLARLRVLAKPSNLGK